MRTIWAGVAGVLALAAWPGRMPTAAQAPASTQAPIAYTVTFPEAEHHWMQVEMTVNGLGATPLRARMSRSSPGRYAAHEFSKNIFWVEAFDGKGKALAYTHPAVDEWDVAGHDGTVRVVYKIFGDTADGTYFGVDTTHAHLNMPAAFMWVMGQDSRPMRITFTPPPGSGWTIATQLYTTGDAMTFTAPNLQYFMDSPTELGPIVMGRFSVPNADGAPSEFRLAVHSDGAQADVDDLAKSVERLVREHMAVFGEFPKYEPGYYTFLLDYVAWGDGDGMEHRNSTSISSPGLSLKTAQGRRQALGTISHEFFHNWNVERIRPAGLEPFDFTRANVTCCLWLAEGFTQYYGPLLLYRAGLGQQVPTGAAIAVTNTSGRMVRSAVQMSEYAPFSDAAVSIDLTDQNRTFLSYYTYGAGIALALDLSLRDLTNGAKSLDDFMRAMWIRHGKPGGPAPGLVARPYTLQDLRTVLAEVSGDASFANTFFDRYVEGREVADYPRLLARAGYVMRAAAPDRGWIGNAGVQAVTGGLMVGVGSGRGGGRPSPVAFNTPLYKAGVDEGDLITTIDGQPATQMAWTAFAQRKPGEKVTLGVTRRDGKAVTLTATLEADPALTVTTIESQPDGALTPAQKAFREAWLGTRVK